MQWDHARPPWLYGHDDSLDGAAALNLVRWVSGSAAPTVPIEPASAATQWLYGSNWARYAIARDAAFDVRTYRPEAFAARVQQTSALMDSTNPDLSAFFARGGKSAVPTMVDLLDPLDRWVSAGSAPPDSLVQTRRAPLPPHALQASRPMCRYPGYPHYVAGDRQQAASYACRPS